jgi:hypothetical protein
MVTPAVATVIVLIIAASLNWDFLIGPAAPEMSLLLGVAGTLTAICACFVSLRPIGMRASGLALALITGASIAQVAARLLALHASGAAIPSEYGLARSLATVATVLDAGALIVTSIWLVARSEKGWRHAVVGVLGSAVTLAELARRSSHPSAPYAEVLLGRSLAKLHREPSSFIPRVFEDTQELMAVGIAILLLFRPGHASVRLRLFLAMTILARSSPDIPLCSGLLAAGAMGLALLAADEVDSSEDY